MTEPMTEPTTEPTEPTTDLPSREVRKPPTVSMGGSLGAMVPTNLDEAFRLAQALALAGEMIPEDFREKPEMIMAAMLKGMEVGLWPMQALASVAVIKGRASLWGDAIPALLLRAGHHIDHVVEGEGDNMVATATLTRSNGKQWVRSFSVADAKAAGLWGKAGPWTQYKPRMLAMRARAWAARDGASDVLMGLEIAEERQDIGPDHARDVTPVSAKPRPGEGAYVENPFPEPAPAVDEVEIVDEHAELKKLANEQAGKGRQSFIVWWNTLSKEQWAVLKPGMRDLEKIAIAAETEAKGETEAAKNGNGTDNGGVVDFEKIAKLIRREIENADASEIDALREEHEEALAALLDALPDAYAELDQMMIRRAASND